MEVVRSQGFTPIYWLAQAMEVRSRVWLGGVISHRRDKGLIGEVLRRVGACGPVEGILLVTDGLASYTSQALKVFREPIRTGKVGRPRLVLAEGVMIARVIKHYPKRRVVEVVAGGGGRHRGGGDLSGYRDPTFDGGLDQHRLH